MKKIIFEGNKNIISTNLKLQRVKNNYSQSDLATQMQLLNINIDQQMISKIENNNRIVTDYELYFFAKALKMNVADLFVDFDSQIK